MAAPSSSSKKIRFLYGYGSKIMRWGNGAKLRYVGGTNRIMAVDRNITYTELIVKLWDTCGPSMSLRCKLPMDDFDKLVHVTCDMDLAYVIERYDRVGDDLKIRVILDPLPPVITNFVYKAAQGPVFRLPEKDFRFFSESKMKAAGKLVL